MIVTPAFLENTFPQDLQILNSLSVAICILMYGAYFTYCTNSSLKIQRALNAFRITVTSMLLVTMRHILVQYTQDLQTP